MRALFLHTNFPAQYRHVAPALAARPGNQVLFGTANTDTGTLAGVEKVLFKRHREVRKDSHHYVRPLEFAVLNGQAVYRMAQELRRRGFVPDVVCAHAGWGVGSFVKDAWPDAALLSYFEWYYNAVGADADFLPSAPLSDDDRLRIRAKNAPILLDMASSDWGLTPTRFQRSQFPAWLAERLTVLHDGVDTGFYQPAPGARLHLPERGLDLSDGDELITYVARGMEPYRGFPQFMTAVAEVLRRRPRAHVVIVGADRVAYGRALGDGRTYKQKMLDELDLDLSRVHFTGLLSYANYRRVLHASAVHVYLTVPFVLSWSMIEAMAAGCLVLGSDTAPVREVIEDGVNGLLVDFFDTAAIARRIEEVLDRPDRHAALRAAARETVLARYALADTLPRHLALIEDVAARRLPPATTRAPA
jgi:glycosyltransferase involved in cell wall biosynthesis